MPLGDYVAGLCAFAGTWGGAAYVAITIERRLLPRLDRAPRAMALALLFLGALIAVHLLPGAVGLLSAPAVTITALLLAVAVSFLPRRPEAARRDPTPVADGDDRGGISRVLAGVGVLGVTAFGLAALSAVRLDPPGHVDAVSFALPGVANWIRSGSIWDVGSFLPLLQVRTYPNNGDVLALAAILPWHSDAFLRLLPLPLLATTGLGVYGIGRELGSRATAAALLGSAAVAAKVVAVPALYDLKPDTFMYATFAGGVLFLLRHVRTGTRSDLLLAGLGLGLSFGSRWYGLTTVVAVLVVWAAALVLARRPLGRVARDAALLAVAVLGAGGFWLLRNLVLTGNPLYPIKVQLLGATLLDAPPDVLTDRYGFTVVDRLGQAGFVGHHLLPGFRSALGLPGALVGAGVVLASVLALRRWRGLGSARALGLVAAIALLTLVYAFLPAGAQGLPAAPVPGIVAENVRWLVPAFLLAAAATAWGVSRLPERARLAAERLALVCALVAARASFAAGAGRVAAAALLLALGWAFAPLLRRAATELVWRSGTKAAVGIAGAAALVLAVAGFAQQSRYQDHRYEGRSAAVDWLDRHAKSGRHVAVAGSWSAGEFVPTYGLFGPRLGNDVSYLGPLVKDQVRLYGDSARFARALRTGGYDLLAVGLLEEPDLAGRRPQRKLVDPREARWARSAGFVEVARDRAFVLLARRASGTPG